MSDSIFTNYNYSVFDTDPDQLLTSVQSLSLELQKRSSKLSEAKEESITKAALIKLDDPISNMLADTIAKAATTSGNPTSPLDVKKEMLDLSDNPIKMLAVNLSSLFTAQGISENFGSTSSFYLYYVIKKNLKKWVEQRITITQKIAEYLMQLMTIKSMYFAGPPVDEDMQIILEHLHMAQAYLQMIRPLDTDTFNAENFGQLYDNIRNGEFKGKIVDQELDTFWKYIKGRADAQILFYIKLADKELETAQNYMKSVEIKSGKMYGGVKLKAMFKEISDTVNRMLKSLKDLAELVPITSGIALGTFYGSAEDLEKNAGATIKKLLNSASLSSLNKKIRSSKLSIKDFSENFPNFIVKTTGEYLRSKNNYNSTLLDSFVTRLETTEYPKNRIDLLMKEIPWYSELWTIRGSLYLINPLNLVNFKGIAEYVNNLARTLNSTYFPDMDNDELAQTLETMLKNKYEKFVKLLILSNPRDIRRLQDELRYLLRTAENLIYQDSMLLMKINAIIPPLGYDVFEKMMDLSLGMIQKQDLLGEAGSAILDCVKSGEFIGLVAAKGSGDDWAKSLLSPVLSIDSSVSQSVTNTTDLLTDSEIYDIEADPFVGPLNVLPSLKGIKEEQPKQFYDAMGEILKDFYTESKRLYETIKTNATADTATAQSTGG
jgi:hypothetical protein